jgi:hypothetical protein
VTFHSLAVSGPPVSLREMSHSMITYDETWNDPDYVSAGAPFHPLHLFAYLKTSRRPLLRTLPVGFSTVQRPHTAERLRDFLRVWHQLFARHAQHRLLKCQHDQRCTCFDWRQCERDEHMAWHGGGARRWRPRSVSQLCARTF